MHLSVRMRRIALGCLVLLAALANTESVQAGPESNQYSIGPESVQGFGLTQAAALDDAEDLLSDRVAEIVAGLPPGHFFVGVVTHATNFDPLNGTCTITFSVVVGIPGPPGG